MVVEGPGDFRFPFPLKPLLDSSEFRLGFSHRLHLRWVVTPEGKRM